MNKCEIPCGLRIHKLVRAFELVRATPSKKVNGPDNSESGDHFPERPPLIFALRCGIAQNSSRGRLPFRHPMIGASPPVNDAATHDNRELLRRRAALLTVSPDLIFWMSHDGVYLDYNATSPEMLIASPAAFLGQRITDVMPGPDGDRGLAMVRRAVETQQLVIYEYTIAFPTGTRHFEARLLATEDEVVALARDVTATVNADGEVARKVRYYESLLAGSSDMIVATDAFGTITFASKAIENILGIAPTDIIGTSALDIIHPDERDIAFDRFVRANAQGGERPPQERRLLHATGGWITCEIVATNYLNDPAVEAVVFHARDVSRRLQQQRRFRFLFETHPMPSAYVLAGQTGIIANGAFARLLGYDSALEIQAVPTTELVSKRGAAQIGQALADGIHAGSTLSHEVEIRRKDGTMFMAQAWATSAAETDDGNEGILIAIEDLSERHAAQQAVLDHERELAATRAERDRAALEARLRQSQRLESTGRLAAGVAHDFTNLLAVTMNYAAVLDRSELSEIQRADLQQIQHSASVAANLAQRLLQFGRAEVGAAELLDLGVVVEGMKSLLTATLGRDRDMTFTIAAGAHPIVVDRGQVEQVVLNLVINARDAIEQGGVITLLVDALEADPSTSVVRLVVADTGTGMTVHALERAFDPFFTTKPQGMGTGLGLSVVDGIVAASNGTIAIESEVGEGTTVTVTWPRAED